MVSQRWTELRNMTTTRPATMAEIAERAGVALSTVSYVLSGKRPVSQKMRERVMEAIEELDYRPHGPARAPGERGMAHDRSVHAVAAVAVPPDIRRSWPARLWRPVPATMRSCSPPPPPSRRRSPERRAGGRADGVILMETLDDLRVERLSEDGHPFVLIGRTAITAGSLRRYGLRRCRRDGPCPSRPLGYTA